MKVRLTTAIALLGLVAMVSGCSQAIDPPAQKNSQFNAIDFFWQSPNLQRGISYNVTRNASTQQHILTSSDYREIFDQTTYGRAMTRGGTLDSVVIDSMVSNSIFNLPPGYFFGKDSIPRSLCLLYRPGMDSGKSWLAGYVSGPGLYSGVPIVAQVLDHVDTLSFPPAGAGADSSFGESFRISYTPQLSPDSSVAAPFYWVVYFSRGVGPVLIEQLSYSYAARYTLGDKAQILRRF